MLSLLCLSFIMICFIVQESERPTMFGRIHTSCIVLLFSSFQIRRISVIPSFVFAWKQNIKVKHNFCVAGAVGIARPGRVGDQCTTIIRRAPDIHLFCAVGIARHGRVGDQCTTIIRRAYRIIPLSRDYCILLCLFVQFVLFALFTKLFQLQPIFEHFFILCWKIICGLAHGALHFDHVVLGHTF